MPRSTPSPMATGPVVSKRQRWLIQVFAPNDTLRWANESPGSSQSVCDRIPHSS